MGKGRDKKKKAKGPAFRSFSFVAFRDDGTPLAPAAEENQEHEEHQEEDDVQEEGELADDEAPESDVHVADLEGSLAPGDGWASRGVLEGVVSRAPYAPDEATAGPVESSRSDARPMFESETELDLAEIGPTEAQPFQWDDEPRSQEPLLYPTGPHLYPTRPERAPPPPPSSVPEEPAVIERRIRSLEEELDKLLQLRDGAAPPRPGRERAAPPARASTRSAVQAEPPPPRTTDEDGFDPAFEESLLPALDFLCERWFRVEPIDVGNVPASGRCLLVANHGGGTLPLDGLVMRSVLRLYHPAARPLRWLSEDSVHHLAFIGTRMARLGAVRACQENAERLLARGDLTLVFPEGDKGLGKPVGERYRLQRFGRGGFIRLCLRARSPLVPVAIVGSEEAPAVNLALDPILKILGLGSGPFARIAARGMLSWLPAPAKWRVRFGAPIRFDAWGPEAAGDDVLVSRLAGDVESRIQRMLDELVQEKRGVFAR